MTAQNKLYFALGTGVSGVIVAIITIMVGIAFAEPVATDPKVFVRSADCTCPPAPGSSVLLEREVRALESIARNLENNVYKVKEQ